MLPPVKKSPVVLSHQNPPIYICLQLFWGLIWAYFSADSDEKSFLLLEKSFLGIGFCIFARSNGLGFKNVLKIDFFFSFLKHSFSLHKILTDGLALYRLLVVYCDVFISCLDSFWRHPFTAEDPMGEQVMQCKWRNFWVNYSFLFISLLVHLRDQDILPTIRAEMFWKAL